MPTCVSSLGRQILINNVNGTTTTASHLSPDTPHIVWVRSFSLITRETSADFSHTHTGCWEGRRRAIKEKIPPPTSVALHRHVFYYCNDDLRVIYEIQTSMMTVEGAELRCTWALSEIITLYIYIYSAQLGYIWLEFLYSINWFWWNCALAVRKRKNSWMNTAWL